MAKPFFGNFLKRLEADEKVDFDWKAQFTIPSNLNIELDCSLYDQALDDLGGDKSLLEDPFAEWKRPAITTYGEETFSARSDRFRYIRYPDGSEELYDHERDPHEWNNLASTLELSAVKSRLAEWIPKEFAPSLGGRLG